MEFGFSTVEGVLSRVHLIREDARSAFAARLKHFQRLEFPEGTNTGRGKAAAYNVGHVMLLALALELVQLGVPPERAKNHVEATVSDYARLCHLMILRWDEEDSPKYAVGLWPSGLLPLMSEAFGQIESMLLFGTLEDFAQNINSADDTQLSRFAYSNLSIMFDVLSKYLAAQLKVEVQTVRMAVLEWTVEVAAERRFARDPQA